MVAIHFICKRDDGISLNNMAYDKASKLHRSGLWDVTYHEARSLVGGWIYLHATKDKPSEFGGIIKGFEQVVATPFAHSKRVIFLVESRAEAKGQKWRGRKHGMAHNSGVVEATAAHEAAVV